METYEEQHAASSKRKPASQEDSDQHDTGIKSKEKPVDDSKKQTGANSQNDQDLIAQIARLEEALSVSEDNYLRLKAEIDNFKKRTRRENEELHKYLLENLMKELLCVLDAFDKGMATSDAKKTSAFVKGMRMVEEQLRKIMSENGLETISSLGKEFDPHIHQAIQKIESTKVKVETIKEEFAKGYKFKGRLIRPAMVSVYVPTEK